MAINLFKFLERIYCKGEQMIKNRGRDLLGKVIVSEETGRKFGVVGDIKFVSESGELLNIVLVETTKHSNDLNLEKDDKIAY